MYAYCILAVILLASSYAIEELDLLSNEGGKRENERSNVIAINADNGENAIIDESFFEQIKQEFFKKLFSDKKIFAKMPRKKRPLPKPNRRNAIRKSQLSSDEERWIHHYGLTTTQTPITVNKNHLVIVNPVEAYGNRQLIERELIRLVFTNGPNVKTSTWLPDYDDTWKKEKQKLQKALEERRRKDAEKYEKEEKRRVSKKDIRGSKFKFT